MAVYTEITLGELIEEALDMLYRSAERPKAVTLSGALAANATSLNVGADGVYIGVSSIVEFDQERMLVTATDSQSSNPTFTVVRGYAGTEPAAHTAGTLGYIDPKWGRAQVRRAILRCLSGPMTRHLPLQVADVFYTADIDGVGQTYFAVPANTIDVLEVRYMSPTNGRIVDLPGWRFENNLPEQVVSSGKAVRVPSFIATSDDLIVTYTKTYEFIDGSDNVQDDPAESDTVTLLLGSEDIPALYTVAYLNAGREVTRNEIDRAEEWNTEMADRRGINLQALRQAWQLYYQRIDEAHRINPTPKKRVFKRWQQPF